MVYDANIGIQKTVNHFRFSWREFDSVGISSLTKISTNLNNKYLIPLTMMVKFIDYNRNDEEMNRARNSES